MGRKQGNTLCISWINIGFIGSSFALPRPPLGKIDFGEKKKEKERCNKTQQTNNAS